MTTSSSAPNYSSLSHADLVSRVTVLEKKLRALNETHAASANSLPAESKKKPKKPPKPFDPSRYNTRFTAFKFAYLGGAYNGFEHHTNNTTPLPTVEEVLWRALRKAKLIFPDFTKVGGDQNEVCWDGVEYSKCGRTDRGVSAFGQVIGLRVRSSRPKQELKQPSEDFGDEVAHGEAITEGDGPMPDGENAQSLEEHIAPVSVWDDIRDELPYIQVLNRILPPSIRILAWCPHPPPDFSARFSCRERRYRYFFTNPAYPVARGTREGTLDIPAMHEAAKKYEGLHDFRNFCKVDPGKQISNFERRIFHAGVYAVNPGKPGRDVVEKGSDEASLSASDTSLKLSEPEAFYFEVRGSAFLWHQVRHLVAVLFLVGQGYEDGSVVDRLLDTQSCPSKPTYEMADDRPLVLWDCIFPDLDKLDDHQDHGANGENASWSYENALEWVYVGDEAGGRDQSKRAIPGIDDGKYGRNGIMDDLWAQWRHRKMDEVLAGSLMDVVSAVGGRASSQAGASHMVHEDVDAPSKSDFGRSDRVFDGGDRARTVGTYTPIIRRERLEAPEIMNARYAARKGLTFRSVEVDMDE
ncbi:hypothetical protein B0A50_00306 [Salinomyces thailandicus]|uniref:Pseudouridine synthase I TruA alpha/beta domain-containing protein n=1 Tax=Salinomyces thailandicus TaxID=706561 RepID=A0A4U0UHV2_9PEZI|nr:hypothetical protein B0A50_00306 [Salinomyces thailandica]